MYITCKLFIPVLGLVAYSMLFILCSPDLRGGRSVLTRHLSSGLHMLSVAILSVAMLSVVMLSIITFNVVLWSLVLC